jgi:hypothetical protein
METGERPSLSFPIYGASDVVVVYPLYPWRAKEDPGGCRSEKLEKDPCYEYVLEFSFFLFEFRVYRIMLLFRGLRCKFEPTVGVSMLSGAWDGAGAPFCLIWRC